MPNRLAGESSPYLQQHADNPVDWYAWGHEALARARTEDKPILVSIGYSACHWCHVMAHESFEDERTAAVMNARFVNIKVDREERPDVDSIYMEAVQALTGSGGWPLNVFLTPDARPFFGGTYFPPEPRHGLPSWLQVLESVAETFEKRKEDVLHNAEILTAAIAQAQRQGESDDALGTDILDDSYAQMAAQFDLKRGGFGRAPKFPQPMGLEFILRSHTRVHDPEGLMFVTTTLDRMADGGICDQLGGGFHRYSVDDSWLVPHFEKMLYDNALLARTYTAASVATGDSRYRLVAEQTLDYLLREMRSPEAAFYCAQDADSAGVEGQYYVWTLEELRAFLSEQDAQLAASRYGVTAQGNFEGKTILTEAATMRRLSDDLGVLPDELAPRLEAIRATLLAARRARVAPATDTKILTGWNALVIRALAEAGRVFGRTDYLEAAVLAMDFVLTSLRPDGRLVRGLRRSGRPIGGFLEDYAFCLEALISVYMTTFNVHYLSEAKSLAKDMVDRFWDQRYGGFFDTSADTDDLVIRPRSVFDNPIPSGNSSAAFALLRLEALTGLSEYGERAAAVFRAARALLSRAPLGLPYMLCALDFYLATPVQIAIAGPVDAPATQALVRTVYDRYLPNAVIAVGEPDSMPLLQDRPLLDGNPTAYVCRRFVCRLPVTTPSDLARQLDELFT